MNNPDTFFLNNKIYSNNNNLLMELISQLQNLINTTSDANIIQNISNAINKGFFIINENRRITAQIKIDINLIYNRLNFYEHNNNNINNNKELLFNDGKYVGQVVNGVAEGKGTWYGINGDRYEGDWKFNKREGKGIYYFNNGNRYEGDFKNGIRDGRGIGYFKNGDKYEGEYKNGLREGYGIGFFKSGNRYEGA